MFLLVECICNIKPIYKVSANLYYCFCYNAEQNIEEQKSQVKNKGGAGVEFVSSGQKYIAVALYENKEIAEKVATKNNGIVQQITLPLLTFYNKKQQKEAKQSYENITFYLSQLLFLSSEFDSGKATESALKSGIDKYLDFIKSTSLPYFPTFVEQEEGNISAYIKFLACDLLFYSIDFFLQ